MNRLHTASQGLSNSFTLFDPRASAPDNDSLALLIAFCTIICYAISNMWSRAIPTLFYAEEKKLEKKLALIREEAKRHTGTDELHVHGKLTREALQLSKQIEELRGRRSMFYSNNSKCTPGTSGAKEECSATDGFALLLHPLRCAFPKLMYYIIRFGFMVPVLYFYNHRSAVVLIPHCFRLYVPILPWVRWALFTIFDPMGWAHTYNNSESVEMSSHEEWWSFGVLTWFIACYVSVNLLDRVMFQT